MGTDKRGPAPAVGSDEQLPAAPATANVSWHEDEDLLRRLFETSVAGVVVSDRVGRVVSANPAAERILGLARSAIVGRAFDSPAWGLLRPDGTPLPATEMASARALAEKRAVNDVVMGAARPDGSVSWMTASAVPLYDAAGEIEGVAGTFLDITARKQAEEALLLDHERFSLAAHAGGVGVWDWDLESDTLTWDEQMFSLYGIIRDQFGGAYEAWQAGVHPDDRQRGDAEVLAALRGEQELDTELRVLWPDGAVHDIRALAHVQRDASGQATRMIGTNWDVTEQKRLEEALRSSAQNFRTFFETMDDIIVVATPDGRLVYANPALSAKLGYSAEEATALHVLDLNPTGRRAEAQAIFAAILRGERASCPLPLQTKSGALIPAETRVWFGQWDGADCVFGVSKDLTKEQEALQKFDRVFHGSPALMAVSDLAERRFTDVNDAFLATLGYARAEVIGCTSEELGLAVEPQQLRDIAEQLQAQGRVSDCELKIMCKDGTILDGLFSGEVIESQGRQYFLTVMVDQTARKQAEQALRESEERHKEMIASISDVIAILDPDGTIRYTSPTIEKYFGWRPAELVGSDGWAMVHPDDLERVQRELVALLEGDDSARTVEHRHKCKDGSYKWIELTATDLRHSALVNGVLVNYFDICKRRAAQDEVRRLNAELEERVVTRTAQRDAFNRELEAFAYSAAHDLRAPLRAIDGFSRIVVEDAAERLTPDELQHLERVRAAAQRMAQMIDDLMGLSKVSRHPLLRRTVDVSAMALEVAEELRAAQPQRRIELVIAPGMTAAADPALLRLVLVQLLDNSWKFTGKHDAARIEVGVTDGDGSADAGGGERVFFVRDDGAGFDMGYAKHLFGAFQRFHTAAEFEGDGIGLATVQRLVLRHGGRVWAAAEVEKGATFFFTLPAAQLAVD
jgi:PAS domain S-box-containing protein